ncbi:hypothetical protein OROMI_000808 [Orobanche minor]
MFTGEQNSLFFFPPTTRNSLFFFPPTTRKSPPLFFFSFNGDRRWKHDGMWVDGTIDGRGSSELVSYGGGRARDGSGKILFRRDVPAAVSSTEARRDSGDDIGIGRTYFPATSGVLRTGRHCEGPDELLGVGLYFPAMGYPSWVSLAGDIISCGLIGGVPSSSRSGRAVSVF